MPDLDQQRQYERAQSTVRHALRHVHVAEAALLRGDYPATAAAVVTLAGAIDALALDLGVAPEVVL